MNSYFSELSVLCLIDGKLDDVEGKNILVRLVDEVVLLKLLRDIVLLVDEQRIELVRH